MVVTMMGVNDLTMMWINDDCGSHVTYKVTTTSKGLLLFKSFKTYKLAKILWLNILVCPRQHQPRSGSERCRVDGFCS